MLFDLLLIYTIYHSSTADVAYSVGDRVYAGDLWVVIELESNGRGLRTALGKAVAAHICSAIKASQAVGWTPLVVGGKSICCRSVAIFFNFIRFSGYVFPTLEPSISLPRWAL